MRSLPQRFHPSRSVLLSIVIVGAIYVTTLLILPAKGLWVVDNADKFLQMKAIIASGYSDYSTPWQGHAIDPDFKYRPIPSPFSYVDHHKMFSFYPPFFPAVSSFLFRAFGFRGLVVLPLLSSLVMLAGVAAIARNMNQDIAVRHIAVLVTGLCTPIWFYSVVFWEHTIAVCLSVWAIVFYLGFVRSNSGRDLVLGSIMAALGVYFRDELYLFCLVLVICAHYWQKHRSLRTIAIAGATMVLTLVPLWLFQWRTIGHPLGYHIGSLIFSESGIVDHILARPVVLYNLFVGSTPHYWLSFVVGGPFLIACLLNPGFSRPRYDLAVPIFSAVALGCSVISLMGYFTSHGPINYMIESCNSFLTVTPVLILAFLCVRNSGDSSTQVLGMRRIWIIALAYSAAYALFVPELGTSGMHWGNRYLLGVYPLLGLLASINLSEWARGMRSRIGWQWMIVMLVILCSLAAQVYSISLLHKKEDFSCRLNQEIQKRPEKIIVTNASWVPLDMYLEFHHKMIFLTSTKEDFDQLVGTLGSAGYDSFLFITQLPDREARTAIFSLHDNGLNFFTLRFFVMQIGPR